MNLEKLPLRVILDTSVIQNILTFGDFIFENNLTPYLQGKLAGLPQNMQADIQALNYILEPVTITPVVPIISELSLHELLLTNDVEKRLRLLQWGFDLLDYAITNGEESNAQFKPNQTILYDFLPGKIDRLLIGESKRSKCQAFITMDYKSILKFKRMLLINDHVTVLSPMNWWEILKPWFRIWV